MKRGISPLLGWVLLVGFAVSMGALILMWSTDLIGELSLGDSQKIDIYCENVGLDIENMCLDKLNDMIKIDLANNGGRNIKALTFSKETSGLPTSYCVKLLDDVSDPEIIIVGENYIFKISLDEKFEENVMCDFVSSGFDAEDDLYMISLVPWIDVDGVLQACTDKEVKLEDHNLDGDVFGFLNEPCEHSGGEE